MDGDRAVRVWMPPRMPFSLSTGPQIASFRFSNPFTLQFLHEYAGSWIEGFAQKHSNCPSTTKSGFSTVHSTLLINCFIKQLAVDNHLNGDNSYSAQFARFQQEYEKRERESRERRRNKLAAYKAKGEELKRRIAEEENDTKKWSFSIKIWKLINLILQMFHNKP